MLTSTYPRHSGDYAGSFLGDLCEALPLKLVVVCPDDAAHDRAAGKVELRTFPHWQVFYGAGAVGNAHARGLRPLATLAALAMMFVASVRATRKAATIWSHWALPGGFTGALCRVLWRRRHILLLHSGDVWLLERLRAGRWLARFIASQTDEVYAVSVELAERFAKLSGRRAQVLGCGVRANPYARAWSGLPHVGTLSRLVPSKGVLALAERRAELRAELHVAGDGPEAAALRALGGAAPPLLHGVLTGEAKLRYLNTLDVFLAPYSRSAWGQPEGLPVAVLEAMTAGCPIVAFESAVPAGLIESGEHGFIVADGDFAALIARANELVADPAKRARMGQAARLRAAPYGLDAVAAQWTRVLDFAGAPRLSR